MEKHITNEETGISYTLIGDFYIPDVALPEGDERHEIGRFGRLHHKYLKEHRRVVYSELLTSGRLNAHLYDIDAQAQEMFDRLIKEYAGQQGVTEWLKADNQMAWVGAMNNIKNTAEEVVLRQIVYQ